MNPEKIHLYKKQYQQPIEEETPPHKGKSKTATTSDSRKRSTHKHIYKKIILHYGSDSFAWGRQCEICGRVDSTYKSSYWNPKEFQVTGEGLYGEWRNICLTEIHRKYPEYTIMTLENAKWVERRCAVRKEFEIQGCIEVPPEVTEDEFWNAFIEFVESKGWAFGGGIQEIQDGYYILANGSRGQHVLEEYEHEQNPLEL